MTCIAAVPVKLAMCSVAAQFFTMLKAEIAAWGRVGREIQIKLE